MTEVLALYGRYRSWFQYLYERQCGLLRFRIFASLLKSSSKSFQLSYIKFYLHVRRLLDFCHNSAMMALIRKAGTVLNFYQRRVQAQGITVTVRVRICK